MPISDMDAHSLEQYINPPKKSISLYMSLRHLAEVMPLENYHMLIYNYQQSLTHCLDEPIRQQSCETTCSYITNYHHAQVR